MINSQVQESLKDNRQTEPNRSVVNGTAPAVDPNAAVDQLLSAVKMPKPGENNLRGVNDRARQFDEVIAQVGGNIDPRAISIAKSAARGAGENNPPEVEKKPNQRGERSELTPNDLKNLAGIANGQETGIPQPEALKHAQQVSNASPQAQAIAQGNGIPLSEAAKIQLSQATENTNLLAQMRILRAAPDFVGTEVRSTPETINETKERIGELAARMRRQGASAVAMHAA